MKRIITLLCAAMLAGQAWADDIFKVGDLYYSTWFGKAYVECENSADNYANNYSGLSTVTIPDKVEYDGDEYPVTGISREAFKNCTSLTSITFTNSLQKIEEYAFEGCSGLESVIIPNSVTSLGENVFSKCTSLESVTLPDAITYIPAAAFGVCTSLTTVEIPNTVTFIGNAAFSGSGLTEIVIPSSVTEISSFAFQDCNGLTTITVPASVEKIGSYAFKGCKNLTINCCASSIPGGWNAYWNYDNRPYNLGSCGGEQTWTVTVSANNSAYGYVTGQGTVTNGSTTTISATPASGYRFVKWSNGLTNATETITVTSDTTLVAEFAEKSSLVAGGLHYEITSESTVKVVRSSDYLEMTSIVIPETIEINGKTYTVTRIGEDAFRDCENLASLNLSKTVTAIDINALWNCSGLTEINVDGANTTFSSVDGVLFNKNKTELIRCPENKSGSSYTIPSSVTDIHYGAFDECHNLTAISIPNSVKYIGSFAFINCKNLTEIVIPDGISEIEGQTFQGCTSLTSVTIPESVTKIDGNAFEDCSSLTAITIPQNVTYIGSTAFSGCYNLTEMNLDGNDYYSFGNQTLFNADKTELLCNMNSKATEYTIPNSVITIGDYAFSDCFELKSITIPNSVTTIGSDAFYRCWNLTSATLPDSLTKIGSYAFAHCNNLTSVIIPESVIDIDVTAFDGCYKLSYNEYGNSYYMGSSNNPFFALVKAKSTDITTCEIHKDCKVIANKAFDNCNNLQYNEYGNALYLGNTETPCIMLVKAKSTEITSCAINSSCRFIMPYAFYDCSKLASITVPNGVTKIGEYAFYNSGLTSISIPNSVTNIGKSAFNSCNNLRSVTIPNSVTSIGDYAFNMCINLKIYSACATQPIGWSADWNPYNNSSIIWNCKSIKIVTNDTSLGSVETNPACGIGVNDSLWYTDGATIKLIANPKNGYHVKWEDGSYDNPRTITITEGSVYTATFEKHVFTNYVYNNDATTRSDGTETAECDLGCGETDTRTAEGTKLPESGTAVAESAVYNLQVFTHGNTIVVENANAEIYVYDAMGRLVERNIGNDSRTEISMNNAGVYIVKVGTVAKRVVVND